MFNVNNNSNIKNINKYNIVLVDIYYILHATSIPDSSGRHRHSSELRQGARVT